MAQRLSGPVWVPDPVRAFVPAIVKESSGKVVTITYTEDAQPANPSKLQFDTAKEDLYPRVEGRKGVSQMDELKMLNMATVLDNVDVLFQQIQSPTPGESMNTIYSSVGPVLIAMNPFQMLPLYGKDWMEAYHQAGADPVQMKRLGPHAYRTAEEAFQGLKRNRMQSVVICGESGAGKTVTNRKMLEMLCEVARRKDTVRGQVGADPAEITMTNELLESFGNATTTRNDNSSRFGKLTSLNFCGEQDMVVSGCGVKSYLLERSRVMGGAADERNYHIFYQLLRGGSAQKYGLEPDPEKYAFTKDGAKVAQPGVYSSGGVDNDDKADFASVLERMGKAGFDADMQTHVFEGIAAILHLGNVKASGGRDSSSVDTSCPAFTEACKLLGLSKDAFSKALTIKVMTVAGKDIETAIGVDDANAMLQSVSKLVYSSIFDHIVQIIDERLTQATTAASTATIGMLDIFGFEDMPTNGFEQMFINLTNERIQHLFNEIVFAKEKQIYEEDGITDLDFLTGPNNIKTVELFLGSTKPRTAGIVGFLSNQIRTGLDDEKIDGANFVSLLNRTYDRHEKYTVCTPMELNKVMKAKGVQKKGGALAADYRECFFVHHYAGQVVYTVKDFVPKSRDSFPSHLGKVMRASSKEHIQEYFPEEAEGKGTIGEKFQVQLKDLADTLCSGETLFVRCIKSNQKKVPSLVDRVSVLEQLIRGGVIAALEMRAAGLPERMTHKEFLAEFGILELKRLPTGTGLRRQMSMGHIEKKKCQSILIDILGQEAQDDNEFALGKNMVFMKSHVLTFLESVRRFRITFYARCVQRKLVVSRVKKVDHAMEEILDAEKLAVANGFQNLKSVSELLAKAKEQVGPVFKALGEARKKHGSGKEHFDKVMEDMKPHQEGMKTCRFIANEVTSLVNTLVTRRKLVDNAFAQKVARLSSNAQEMLERVAQVERDCEDCADACSAEELAAARSACNDARTKLQTLVRTTLPELKAKGPSSVDLSAGLPVKGSIAAANEQWLTDVQKSSAFNIDSLLGEVTGLVTSAEANSGAVLKVRKAFLEAVAELDARRVAAGTKLEALQGPAKQCIAVGFEEVMTLLNDAVKADQKLTELEAVAKDPDAFRQSFADYEAAVEKAVGAVEKGKEELKRREEELRRRRQLRTQLDKISEEISTGMNLSTTEVIGDKVSVVVTRMNELLRDMAELRRKEDVNVEEWAGKIQKLEDASKDTLEDFQKQLDEEREERRENFRAKASIFGGVIRAKGGGRASVAAADAEAARSEDENDPEVIIRRLGLQSHASNIHDIDQAIVALKDAGLGRSQVNEVISKLMKARFPIGGASFAPPKR